MNAFPAARDLAVMLADRIDALVLAILPAARRSGGYWQVGNVEGDAGRSLYVHRYGVKAGRWTDKATGQFGDPLDLVNAAFFAGQDLRAAFAWARASAGPRSRQGRILLPCPGRGSRSASRTSTTKRRSNSPGASGERAAPARYPSRNLPAGPRHRLSIAADTQICARAEALPNRRYAAGTARRNLRAGWHGHGRATDLSAARRAGQGGRQRAEALAGQDAPWRLPSGAAERELGLAEGIETGLSAMELHGIPVWAACGSRMDAIAIPDAVERLVIFADNGRAGAQAAERAATQHERPGRRVEIKPPPPPTKTGTTSPGLDHGQGPHEPRDDPRKQLELDPPEPMPAARVFVERHYTTNKRGPCTTTPARSTTGTAGPTSPPTSGRSAPKSTLSSTRPRAGPQEETRPVPAEYGTGDQCRERSRRVTNVPRTIMLPAWLVAPADNRPRLRWWPVPMGFFICPQEDLSGNAGFLLAECTGFPVDPAAPFPARVAPVP